LRHIHEAAIAQALEDAFQQASARRARRCLDNHPHAGSVSLHSRTRRVVVLRAHKNGAPDEADAGERWGCLVQDRPSRFIAACATRRIGDDLVENAVTRTWHVRKAVR
jgi:hypothetical protein